MIFFKTLFQKTLADDPTRFEKTNFWLKQAFSNSLPLDILNYYINGRDEAIHVLHFLLQKNLCADEIAPLTIFIVLSIQPEKLLSTMTYLIHFLEKPFETKLLSNSDQEFSYVFCDFIGVASTVQSMVNNL